MRRFNILLALVAATVVAAGCSQQKQNADKVLDSVEASLAAIRADAEHYAPDGLKSVDAQLARLKASYENKDYNDVIAGTPQLSKAVESLENAVKSGNIQMGNPAGAAATVFPEMGVFLVPYLVQSYAHAYKMFNGAIGDALDKQFQDKYKLKVMCFFDYGFRHFWTAKKPIIEPKDLRGAKIRVQQAKVFGDTINGLGGNAVPMAWGEVISAAKSGVIDGGDLPIVNQIALKIYEVSKYCSMTFHNYGPTLNTMNLAVWEGLSDPHKKLMLDTSREAQTKCRELTESVDNFAAAKKELEPKGMTVVEADVDAFKKVAQEKIWPQYKQQYAGLWDQIVEFKA